MTERSEAHKIAADVLASQHMRADRTVQAIAPLAREYLRMVQIYTTSASAVGEMKQLADG